jgi:outer membrane receptor protein involved in Fe transport
MEDIWDITADLRLTIGGRYDHYSDFGGQFSPRVGLNWEFWENYYVKLLYGRSFRAPAFFELQSNPDLEAETREGYSLTLGGRFLKSLTGQATFFYGTGKDSLVADFTDPTRVRRINSGKGRGRGLELALKYDFGRGTYLAMNYVYCSWELHDPDQRIWMQPQQMGTLMANVRLNRYLNLNTYLLYRGDCCREVGDTREDHSDYAVVNATLIARKFLKGYDGLELRASVHNLFDKDYTSPLSPTELPDDLPMPGRTFLLEMRYKF